MSKTIFVSLCSLEDTELVPTIINCLNTAKNKKLIKIGIAHTILFKNPKIASEIKQQLNNYMDNVSYKVYSLTKNIGVGNGRMSAYKEYSGEDYFLQLDSHTMFDQHWDEKVIEIYEDAKKTLGKEKIILTAYIAKYLYNQNKQRILKNPSGWLPTTATLHDGSYADKFFIDKKDDDNNSLINLWKLIPQWNDDYAEGVWGDFDNKFFPAYKLSGGFQFGDKNFANDYLKMYPFPFYFFEEEFITTVEAIDLGYSLVFPNMDIPFAHLYGDEINEYGGFRSSIGGREDLEKITKKSILNYFNINKEKIKKWEKYANFDLNNKNFLGRMSIPDEFLTSKNIKL